MFRRILVANRGEIALRIIHAAHQEGAKAVAVYSEADADSPHLDAADARVCIGPPQAPRSYLDQDALLQAAEQMDCQAIHPGFGFLAENAVFAERCEQQKITFIGPTSRAIRLMGDKTTAKQTVAAVGLPLLPGSPGNLADVDEARTLAAEIGYPVLLKATAGGGGKGMRVCRDESELALYYVEARAEAEKAFGNPAMYLEKFLDHAKHIEFQVLADAFGHAVHLFERECSVQRNHQKLIEEAPSAALTDETRRATGERVAAAVARLGYRNAGTVEFVMDAGSGELYFMEMNTRLQVEHPVTEMITGVDIVREMLRVAANRPLSLRQEAIEARGHAIECRINAEDPANDFAPSPGTITTFTAPEGAVSFGPLPTGESGARPTSGVRLDTHVRAGYTIPPYYDSMIAKLITLAESREESIESAIESLGALTVEGVKTTIPMHQRVLRAQAFKDGSYTTRLIQELGPAPVAS